MMDMYLKGKGVTSNVEGPLDRSDIDCLGLQTGLSFLQHRPPACWQTKEYGMEQQENENWEQDGDYIWLLEWFIHSTTFEDESSILFAPSKKPQEMISKLFEAGALVEADLAASAIDVFKIREVRRFLEEAQIPPIGTKKQMIHKLIAHDETILRKKLNPRRTFVTSDLGKKVIEEYYDRLLQQYMISRKQMFDALVDKNILKACLILMEHRNHVSSKKDDERFPRLDIEKFKLVFEDIPPILFKKYGEQKLVLIQAVRAIELERRLPEETKTYLPEDFDVTPDEIKMFEILVNRYKIYLFGVNFLKYHHQPGKITFPVDAPDICEHCRSQSGRIITPENIPEWPLAGCTNPKGCLPDFDRVDALKN